MECVKRGVCEELGVTAAEFTWQSARHTGSQIETDRDAQQQQHGAAR